MIRKTCIALSTAGFGWAWLGLGGLLFTSGCLLEDDMNLMVWLFSFQILFGYFVWVGWIFRARNKKYLIKRKTLWLMSLIHHLIWLAVFTISVIDSGDIKNPFVSLMFLYLGVVFSAFCLLYQSGQK